MLNSISLSRSRPCLHAEPPATPSSFFKGRSTLLAAIGSAFVVLAIAVAVNRAWLPLQWDLPIQRFVEDHRTAALDSLFLAISRLGSTVVVLAVSVMLIFLTWRRCRAVSIAILVAATARPLLEFVLKDVVGRARPNFERLVDGQGYSFPSGHVMAAIALYGLLPVVVGLFTRSPRVVVGVGWGVGHRHRCSRREPRLPRRALVLGRCREPVARLVLLTGRRSSAPVRASTLGQRPGLGSSLSKRPAGRSERYDSTTGSSSAGVAPCMITPSTPSSN